MIPAIPNNMSELSSYSTYKGLNSIRKNMIYEWRLLLEARARTKIWNLIMNGSSVKHFNN